MKYDIEKRFQNYMSHCYSHLDPELDRRQIMDLRQTWISCVFDTCSALNCGIVQVETLLEDAEKKCNELLEEKIKKNN